ncbi:Taraxerol synthase [Vitis vinifera]|uniref:Taraxerol synthase n=1 Tax=Vitis vinifera TaxID=29760 RepID=A0A438FSB2_VITVI|nr:Taraxerol synthase [Vitis vinifera]
MVGKFLIALQKFEVLSPSLSNAAGNVGEKIELEWLYDSVNLLLSQQSKNGGLLAWESAGASKWLESLNPTKMFEDVVFAHEQDSIQAC